jgi:hypothetical protein
MTRVTDARGPLQAPPETQSGDATRADDVASAAYPFDAGPFAQLPAPSALRRLGGASVRRRALLAVAVAWVPLVVLATIQGYALRDDPRESLLLDLSTYSRYLIALPLLILAEAICLPRLALIARHFGRAGLVREPDQPAYDHLLDSTRRLLHSRRAAVVILLAAYALSLSFGRSVSPVSYADTASTWVAPVVDGTRSISLAGLWRGLVSQPLLIALLGTWFWRMALWTRFLNGVGRLDLRLVPAHPDLAGGLRFVATSLPPFAVLAFALGTWLAGGVANALLYDARAPRDFRNTLFMLLVLVLLLCAGPLFTLARPLLRARLRGALEYGTLSTAVGQRFEEQWLARGSAVDVEALGAPDFSATTDLSSITANVRQMRMIPFGLWSLVPLVVATLLPFVPVVLIALPVDQLLEFVGKLLL